MNSEWWQWDCMMNVDENMDNLKDYAGTTCILEHWNPPTPWRHVSYLTMSNFDAQAQVEGISMLAPFTAQRVMSVDNGISDGLVGKRSMTFQESFDKYFFDGNDKWWQWGWMTNIHENMDDLKYYASTTCILEPWNPSTSWRHVTYLTMSNFDAYRNELKQFQRWPLSLLNLWRWWIIALVIGL